MITALPTRSSLLAAPKPAVVFAIVGLLAAAAVLAWLPVVWAAGLLAATAVGALVALRPLIGLYALALAVPLTPQVRLPIGAGALSITDVLIAGVLLAWWLRLVASRDRVRPAPYLWLILPFGLALLFSTLAAQSLEQALPELVKWAEVAVVYFLGAQLLTSHHRLPFAITLLAAAAIESLFGLQQFLFRIGPDAYLLGDFLRAYGTFGQPNPYAGYLGLALPIALSLALWTVFQARWERGRLIHLASIVFFVGLAALIGAGLVASWSRGAWLGAAAAAVAVLILASASGRLALAAGAIAVLLAYPILPAPLTSRFAEIVAYFGVWNARGVAVNDANFSVLERVAHWQVAWEMFADHPWLGVGIGNWEVAYPSYAFSPWTDPLGHAHNVFFHFAAEAGILGALTFLWFWLGSLAVAARATLRSRGLDRAVAIGVFGLLVHLSVHNQFDNLFVQGMPIVVALALALLPRAESKGATRQVNEA